MAYERKTIDTWELQLNYGFREDGCKKCLLKHTDLLSKPRED